MLSESVHNGLKSRGGDEASQTAKFALMMDRFFDSLNVHNYTEGIHKRKPFQLPYISEKDRRLKVGYDGYTLNR